MIAIGNNYDFALADEFTKKLPEEFVKEQSNAMNFWYDYRGPFAFLTDFLDKAGRWFNDLYLKINGAQNGEGSYDNPWDVIETPVENPDTGETEIVYEPVYSEIHKIFFGLYEKKADKLSAFFYSSVFSIIAQYFIFSGFILIFTVSPAFSFFDNGSRPRKNVIDSVSLTSIKYL